MYVNAIKNLYSGCVSAVKIENQISDEFEVTKGLRQGCVLAPTLFKIYLNEALQQWMKKCRNMGIQIHDKTLFTLFFADDQVVVAADEMDSNYMMRKLVEEYKNWGLTINIKKTEYLVVGERGQDLNIESDIIKNTKRFKYLGVTFTESGTSNEDINNKIGQGRRTIKQLNSVLWSDKITKETKTTIYKSIVESIATYGSEVWEVTEKNKKKLKALEMDFWRRSCGVSRLEHIRNEEIRQRMAVQGSIIDTIEEKRLRWYGHLQRMHSDRWPKKVWDWTPNIRRKRGRPPRNWAQEVHESMEARGLQEGDWLDKKAWRAGCEIRLRP